LGWSDFWFTGEFAVGEELFQKAIKRLQRRCLWGVSIFVFSCTIFFLIKADVIPPFTNRVMLLDASLLLGFLGFAFSFGSAVIMVYYKLAGKKL
jgi:hypothetical protein